MSQYTTFGDFKWCNPNTVVIAMSDDSKHDKYLWRIRNICESYTHCDLPLAPEHRISLGSKQAKLVKRYLDKEQCVSLQESQIIFV